MVEEAKLRSNIHREEDIKERKEQGFFDALADVDEAEIPFGGEPIQFPDTKHWKQITGDRAKRAADHARHRRSQQEIDIEKKLQTPVNYSCHNRPLNEVLNQLAKLVNVNIHIDEQGLREEGLTPDVPVTLELNSDIMLKSYLNLLLEKNHLCYIIKHEVLNITSETKKSESSQIYQVVYQVGDLVMPIPNFVASPRMGLAGALHDAMSNAVGAAGNFGTMTTPMAVVSNSQSKGGSMINPAVMANAAHGPLGNQAAAGPGGAAGGTGADFDSLIDLITQTVAPPTWDHNGGKGSVAPAPANLSLVISQTQEVHEEIVDLLEQLRRMQDLQVTIEVRFITLNDNFFEQIGVDFDFTIAKNICQPDGQWFQPLRRTVTVGGQPFTAPSYTPNAANGVAVSGIQGGSNNPAQNGIFTADNSVQFTQGSYALGVPQFGGFDAAAGATVGFAILSDIEAFFFINAAVRRSADERPPGAQGHALQWPASVCLRHVADAVRDQRDSRGGRLRRGPAARDRRPQRRHVHDRAGRGLQRSPLRAIDDRALLQQDRQRADVHLPGNRHDYEQHDAERHRQHGHESVQQQQRPDYDVALRRDGTVAHVLLRHGDHDGQRARRRYGAPRRHQAAQRGPQ